MGKKSNFNVPVWDTVIKEFNDWAEKVAGHKGDKLAAALRAIQALYHIDKTLAMGLMQPDITAKKAEALIREAIVEKEVSDFLLGLTPNQRRKVLLDAQEYKDRPSRRK